MMTEKKLCASDFIGVSLFNPVREKSRRPSGCQWEAEGTSLSVFDPDRGFAVPSHEGAGMTWLSDGRVYLALLRPSKSSWKRKKQSSSSFIIFTTSFFS